MANGIISKSSYLIIDYSYRYTISANGSLNITADDMGISAPVGYSPVAVVRFGTGNTNIVVRYINVEATGSSNVLGVTSRSASALTQNASVSILYLRL